MGNISKKEKILLVAVLAACIAFLYIQLYLPKQTEKINGLKANISEHQSKLESLELTAKQNGQLKKDLDKLELKYIDTVAAFPKDGRVPEITYNIEEFTKKSGITFNSVALGESQEYLQGKSNDNAKNGNNGNNGSKTNNNNNTNNVKTPISTSFKLFVIPTSVAVTGEYLKINNFLSTIENDTRLAKIESLTLATIAPNKLSATFLANYYYVPGNSIDLEYKFNNGVKNKEDMFREN